MSSDDKTVAVVDDKTTTADRENDHDVEKRINESKAARYSDRFANGVDLHAQARAKSR